MMRTSDKEESALPDEARFQPKDVKREERKDPLLKWVNHSVANAAENNKGVALDGQPYLHPLSDWRIKALGNDTEFQ